MKKYYCLYLVFWLPALLVSFLFNNTSAFSHILQWAFAGIMVVGWSVTTGFATYHYPKRVLALILLYGGINAVLITTLYAAHYNSGIYTFINTWGGVLSFQPLDILVKALLDFSIPHEFYVTGLVVVCCLIGYIVGLVYRRIRPNPYRPRLLRRQL